MVYDVVSAGLSAGFPLLLKERHRRSFDLQAVEVRARQRLQLRARDQRGGVVRRAAGWLRPRLREQGVWLHRLDV